MRTFTVTPYFARRTLASDLWHEMDRLFDTVIPSDRDEAVYDERAYGLACDVVEHEDHYIMSVDVPGVKPEDVKIELVENMLTISGERKREARTAHSKFQRLEKSYGFFRRTFTLPETANAEKIEACYEDGVLELYLPKAEAAKPRQISIQSNRKSFLGKLLGSSTEEKDTKENKQH